MVWRHDIIVLLSSEHDEWFFVRLWKSQNQTLSVGTLGKGSHSRFASLVVDMDCHRSYIPEWAAVVFNSD